MRGFSGFPFEDVLVPVPATFFSELLPIIDDLVELKLTLYVLQSSSRAGGKPFRREDLLAQPALVTALAEAAGCSGPEALAQALERAVARGTLIKAIFSRGDSIHDLFLLNDPAGRELAEEIRSGQMSEEHLAGLLSTGREAWRVERPNIFVLYEQNIGLLQPLIVDELREAERAFPPAWIEEAFKIAVERNVRNWRYIRAILDRWAREGKSERNDDGAFESNHRKIREKYTTGKYSRLIKR